MFKKKIAIMQPYFFPYLGYFKLLPRIDTFVFLDHVQHVRRGFIHRNLFILENGKTDWMTVPIVKSSQKSLINEQIVRTDCIDVLEKYRTRFKHVFQNKTNDFFLQKIFDPGALLYKNLEETIKDLSYDFGFKTNFISSSALEIDDSLSNQSLIIDICKQMSATNYINLSGGNKIYDKNIFNANNIKLEFLEEYKGEKISVLESLCKYSKKEIQDILIS